MQTLITGGAGFIGTHLANRLHRQGWQVHVLDNLSRGQPEHLDPGIVLHQGDVNDIPGLWSLLPGVDVVFHLAALVSVPTSDHYPREYNQVNVGGTVALLEACRDVGVQRVVLTSSATVYGTQVQQPVPEDVVLAPRVPYAVSKVAAENYLFAMARRNHFEAVALRIFNAYGPYQAIPHTHAPVIPRIMRDTLSRRSVVVFGDGQQTRDFVYVDDVVDALVKAAVAAAAKGAVINIGSGREVSINELVAEIGAAVGLQPNVLHNRDAIPGTPRLVANITRAQDLLQFQPRVDLPTGLKCLYDRDPAFRRSSPPAV